MRSAPVSQRLQPIAVDGRANPLAFGFRAFGLPAIQPLCRWVEAARKLRLGTSVGILDF